MNIVIHSFVCAAFYLIFLYMVLPHLQKRGVSGKEIHLPGYFLLALIVIVPAYAVSIIVFQIAEITDEPSAFPKLFVYLLLFYLVRRQMKNLGISFKLILFSDKTNRGL